MFADDLIILSESATGLQMALDKLAEYCRKWGLSVNVKKTKVIVFNQSGKAIKTLHFYWNDLELEVAKDYCYLGVIFDASGSFSPACRLLSEKAGKDVFKLRQVNADSNVQVAILFSSR